jgi:hypothetical protein
VTVAPDPVSLVQTNGSPTLQPDATAHHEAAGSFATKPADIVQSGLHPDDTTPIPRPSRYYGRPRDELAEHFRKERRNAERQRADQYTHAASGLKTDVLSSPAPGKIDKSELTLSEPKRLRDKAHLRYVASQSCLICARHPCDAHHLRFAQPRAIGMKVSDEFTVPLCRTHHRQLHQIGDERVWWAERKIHPLEIAQTLWRSTHPIAALQGEASSSLQSTPTK